MDKIYRVFISSTFKDLQEERREIIQTLLEIDCVPTGMEMFHASDDTQWELIKKVIDSCDYYIVIISGRYGSVDPKTQKSYTQMEYEYALASGIPILGFVYKDIEKLPFYQVDNLVKLKKFIELVEKKHVRYWKTPEELAKHVSLSIHKIVETHPRAGWIKGSSPVAAAENNGDITWDTPGALSGRLDLSYSSLVEISNIILGSGITSMLNFFDIDVLGEEVQIGIATIQIVSGTNWGGYASKSKKYSTSYTFSRPFRGLLTFEMDPEFWDSFYLNFEGNLKEPCIDNKQREEYIVSGIRETGSIFSGACCTAISDMIDDEVKPSLVSPIFAIHRFFQEHDLVFLEGKQSVRINNQKINAYFTTDLTSINQLAHFYEKSMSIRSERKKS